MTKSDRKYFQFRLRPDAHAVLKSRAKLLNVSIGEMIENLVTALELRLDRAYEILDIEKGLTDDVLLRILIRKQLIDQEELKAEIKQTARTNVTGIAGLSEATITIPPAR